MNILPQKKKKKTGKVILNENPKASKVDVKPSCYRFTIFMLGPLKSFASLLCPVSNTAYYFFLSFLIALKALKVLHLELSISNFIPSLSHARI